MNKHPNHTSGPWEIDRHFWANNCRIWGPDGMAVCFVEDRGGETMDVARRIVACVNACAGLPQDALDGGWTSAGMSAYAKRLEQWRDNLLLALKGIKEHCPCDPDSNDEWLAAWNMMLDVIAKAESKEAA